MARPRGVEVPSSVPSAYHGWVPIPRLVARFNRHVTNPLARLVAGWLPPFGIVGHQGRLSGRPYETPVAAFRTGHEYVVALTYGSGAEWVRNVLKSGRCTLRTRGRCLALGDPTVVRGPAGMKLVPRLVRPPLRALGVTEFLRLSSMPS
jgi:deazaflavin-dependent oxidoreductase (nitroreductase family)